MNPELERNLWLEAQPRQLIGAGAILALLFAAVWLVARGRHPYAFVGSGALVFVVSALLWGPRAARSAVIDEVYARTWDFQRLSALSSWALTWGKLAGATCRAWLFGGVGLVIALLQLASLTSAHRAGFWLLVAVGLAVLMQASGLAVGLIEIRKARAAGRPPGLRSPVLLVLILAVMAGVALFWAREHLRATPGEFGQLASGTIDWWGRAHDPVAFAAASLIVFAGFAVLWAWRLMRLELQLVNAPWAWVLFALVVGFYAAGFAPAQTYTVGIEWAGRLRQAAAAFALLAYAAVFAEPADRIGERLFVRGLLRFDLGAVLKRLPLVIVPAKLCAVTAIIAAILFAHEGERGAALITLANLAFVVRDLGAIAAMRFSPRGRGGDFGVLFGLALLYVVGAIVARAFGGEAGMALAVPDTAHPTVSLVGGLVEAVLAWSFAGWRIAQPSERPAQLWRARVAAAVPPPPSPTGAPPTEGALSPPPPDTDAGKRPWS